MCNDIVDSNKNLNCPAKTKSAIIHNNEGKYTCYPIATDKADIKVELSGPRTQPEFNYTEDVLKSDGKNGRLKITYTQENKCPIT